MKQEYRDVRFLVNSAAEIPERFGIVTACNPNGAIASKEENRVATERLRSQLRTGGFQSFEVTGCSPASMDAPADGSSLSHVQAALRCGNVFWQAFPKS